MPVATGNERVVEALSEEEIEKFLFYVNEPSKVSIRNRLIVYLLLYTAIRVSEIVHIKLSDIDAINRALTVRGKGGKVREIGIRRDVMELIQVYLVGERKESRFSDSEYLLLSQRSKKMHRDAERDWLANISDYFRRQAPKQF